MNTPTTNEPKMPEVIYLNDHFALDTITNKSELHSYTRTDKVQKLKEALRECVAALEHYLQSTGHSCEQTRNAFTKASNLLK